MNNQQLIRHPNKNITVAGNTVYLKHTHTYIYINISCWIRVMPYDHQGISFHGLVDCLFRDDCLSMSTLKKWLELSIIDPLCWESTGYWQISCTKDQWCSRCVQTTTSSSVQTNNEVSLVKPIPQINRQSNCSKHSIMYLTRFRGHTGLLTGLGSHIALHGATTGPPATAEEISVVQPRYLTDTIQLFSL